MLIGFVKWRKLEENGMLMIRIWIVSIVLSLLFVIGIIKPKNVDLILLVNREINKFKDKISCYIQELASVWKIVSIIPGKKIKINIILLINPEKQSTK